MSILSVLKKWFGKDPVQKESVNTSRPKPDGPKIPNEGYAWNPISDWPRNSPCVCGSTKKFKACHYGRVPLTCKVEDEEKLKKLVQAVKTASK